MTVSKLRARDLHLQKKYGITLAQYEQLLLKQNHCCALCLKNASNFKRALHVDHNHRSKKVRALVCFHCNHQLIRRHTHTTAKRLLLYFEAFDPGS